MNYCSIFFRLESRTVYSERVIMVGSLPQLGNWDPNKGIELRTSVYDYPYWCTIKPIKLPKGTHFEFKYLIMVHDKVLRWENLPLNSNRHYIAKYNKVILTGKDGNGLGKEIIEKHDSLKRQRRLEELDVDRKSNSVLYSFEHNSDGFQHEHLNRRNSFSDSPHSRQNNYFVSRAFVQIDIDFMKKENNSNYNHQLKNLIYDKTQKYDHKRIEYSELYEKLIFRNPEKLSDSLDLLHTKSDEMTSNISYDESIIISTLYLPIKIVIQDENQKDLSKKYEISFIYQTRLLSLETFLFSRVMSHYKKLIWLGMLKDPIDNKYHKEITEILFEKYHCKVIFPSNYNEINIFYKKIWKPIWRTLPEESLIHDINTHRTNYLTFQKIFLKELLSIYEESAILIIFHPILGFISKEISEKNPKAKISIYLNDGFPNKEAFNILPYAKEWLNWILYSKIILFKEIRDGERFLDILRGEFFINYDSERGSIYIMNSGKRINIRMGFPGVDPQFLENFIKKNNEFINLYQNFNNNYQKKKVILMIEELRNHKELVIKLHYIKQFLTDTHNRFNLKLILILKTKELYLFLEEYSLIKEKINEINNIIFYDPYENEAFETENLTVKLLETPINKLQIYVFMTLVNILFVNSNEILNIIEYLILNEKNGICLTDDYSINLNIYQSVWKYNVWKYENFKDKLKLFLNSGNDGIELISLNDKNFLKKNTILNWFENLILDLKKNSLYHNQTENNYVYSKLPVFRTPNSEPLNIFNFIDGYRKSANRLFILSQESVFPLKTKEKYYYLKKTLKLISEDPLNTISIISSLKSSEMPTMLIETKGLDLYSENGFTYKSANFSEWKDLFQLKTNWISQCLDLIKGFQERTPKSQIICKNSTLVWDYNNSDFEIARKQSLELENLLRKNDFVEKIEIVNKTNMLEIRPMGVNSAEIIVEKTCLEKGKLDFLFVVDNVENGEIINKMREMIKKKPNLFEKNLKKFLCVIGKGNMNCEYISSLEILHDLFFKLFALYT